VLPVSGVGVQLQFIENQWVGEKHPIKIRVFTDVYIRYINAVSWRVTMVCWIGLGFFFFSFHAGRFKTSILGVGFNHTSLSQSTLTLTLKLTLRFVFPRSQTILPLNTLPIAVTRQNSQNQKQLF
jgi:hypothetical protein